MTYCPCNHWPAPAQWLILFLTRASTGIRNQTTRGCNLRMGLSLQILRENHMEEGKPSKQPRWPTDFKTGYIEGDTPWTPCFFYVFYIIGFSCHVALLKPFVHSPMLSAWNVFWDISYMGPFFGVSMWNTLNLDPKSTERKGQSTTYWRVFMVLNWNKNTPKTTRAHAGIPKCWTSSHSFSYYHSCKKTKSPVWVCLKIGYEYMYIYSI